MSAQEVFVGWFNGWLIDFWEISTEDYSILTGNISKPEHEVAQGALFSYDWKKSNVLFLSVWETLDIVVYFQDYLAGGCR